jgi:hypothetical protein
MGRIKLVTGFVVILIIVLAFFVLQSQLQSFPFKAQQDGIDFYSTEMDPFQHLSQLRDKPSFLVVLSLQEEGGELNAITGQALNELAVVLTANQKQIVTLAKVFDSSNNLVYCQTNKGDIRTSESISPEECQATLSHLNNQVLIELYSPNYLLANSRVVLQPNQIRIQPKNKNDLTGVPHTLLTALFPNTNQLINQVNQRTQDVIDSLPSSET